MKRWWPAVLFFLGCMNEGPSDITSQRVKALRSGKIEDRRAAASHLVLRKKPGDTPVAVAALIQALDDKDPIVRMNVWQSLRHLTQEELPLNKDDWERWWEHIKRIREGTLSSGDPADAIRSERAKVYNTKGLLLMQEGMFSSAARRFQWAIDHDPQAAYHSNLARCHINMRDYQAALLACEDALAKAPNLRMAYLNMGDAWAEMPGLDHAYEAYSTYKKGIRLDRRGTNWAAHWGLSRVLFRRARATTSEGLYDEAAGEIQQALAIARRTGELKHVPQLHRDAALIYYGLGRYYQAYKETVKLERAGYTWDDEDFLRKLDDKLAEMGHISGRERVRRLKAAQGKKLPPAMRHVGLLKGP